MGKTTSNPSASGLNDGADENSFQRLSEELKAAFQTILSEKSSFEK